mgnify:CR=1 FL=1
MLLNFSFRTSAGIGIVALVSACSGGGGAFVTADSVAYPELTTNTLEEFDLSGAGIRINAGTGVAEATTPRVQSDRHFSAISVSDGVVELTDHEGPSRNGHVRDVTQASAAARLFPTYGYDYVMPMSMTYYEAGQEVTSIAMVGAQTKPQDMPTSGLARMTGTSVIEVVSTDGDFGHPGSSSVVFADFGAGTADVTLIAGTPVNNDTLREEAPVFSSVVIDDMEIDGSTLSGGTLRLENHSMIPILGTLTGGADVTANGAFFGLDDETGRPVEVAGQVYAINEAEEWALIGLFMAD